MSVQDSEIRAALREKLLRERASQADTLVRPEMALLRGSVRVDVAVINHSLHGYELKTNERASLDELYGQVPAFSSVLDKVTVVARVEHLPEIAPEVPGWWELLEVSAGEDGQIDFRVVREGGRNNGLDPYAVAQLLWRDEAVKILLDLGVTGFRPSASCPVLWNALVDELSLEGLCETVRAQLRARRDWPSAESPRSQRRVERSRAFL